MSIARSLALGAEPGSGQDLLELLPDLATAPATDPLRPEALLVQTLVDGAHLGICMLDADCVIRVWNDRMEELFGTSAALARGQVPGQVSGLAGLPELVAELERMGRGEALQVLESDFQRPAQADSEKRWLRIKRAPVVGLDGRFEGAIVTAECIERQQFADGSLTSLQKALESVAEMALELNRHGFIVDANAAALASLGYEREALLGQALEVIDASPGQPPFALIYEQLATRGTYAGDALFRGRTGTEIAVEVVMRRVDEAGREFILLLARDARERGAQRRY